RILRSLDLDLDQLSGGTFLPGAYALGGETVSFELPAAFPGKLVHVTARGAPAVVEGRLVADAPLRFVRAPGGRVSALALDGSVSYAAVERVTAAAPWSAASPATGCCGWWEHTLWRSAPGMLDRGLVRVVTPTDQAWSVIDLHRPDAV